MKEIDLVDIFNKYLLHEHYFFANEIRMGVGIPDVMISLNPNIVNTEIDDYRILKILNMLSRKKNPDFSYLQEKTYFDRKQINQMLNTLKENGLIVFDKKNISLVNSVDFQNQGTNISIEVKLNNWRAGVMQAQRYLSFSDYSYLALSSNFIANVDTDLLKKRGIGLLSIDQSIITEVLRPRKSKRCNKLFKYISISKIKNKSIANSRHPNNFFRIKDNTLNDSKKHLTN